MAHKILVVDDQPFMVRLIQHHLEKAGYELLKASTPTEAQALMAEEMPKLVLLKETVESAATALPTPPAAIPIIKMTDVPETLSNVAGELDEVVLRKPFSPSKLVAEVKRLLPEPPATETK